MSSRRLLAPLAYTALLYGTLPFVRGATDFLRQHNLLRAAIIGLCLAIGGWALAFLVRRQRIALGRALGLLGAFGAIYGALFLLIPQPEEFAHFIEYGLLPLLWMGALHQRLGKWRALVITAVICALTGLGDELIQGVLPSRYFEWRDVGINVAASILGLAVWVLGR